MKNLFLFSWFMVMLIWVYSSCGTVPPVHLEWSFDGRAHVLELGRK